MKQVNLRINQKILSLLVGLFLCVGAYAQTVTVKGHVVDAGDAGDGASLYQDVGTAFVEVVLLFAESSTRKFAKFNHSNSIHRL